ncbi:MAG: hypothetical protein E6Q59_00615 [Nitrosomonas sp.]|nr:MAG: hypothetical protein E6Q59_00615 [Nitrosomonas sp.]
MNQKSIELAKDPDLAGSLVAIRRAAQRARQLAVSTNTELVVLRNGKCVHIKPSGEQKPR